MPINNAILQFASQPSVMQEHKANSLANTLGGLKVQNAMLDIQGKQRQLQNSERVNAAMGSLDTDPQGAMRTLIQFAPETATRIQQFQANASEAERKAAQDKARQMYAQTSSLMARFGSPDAFNASPLAQKSGMTWDMLKQRAVESAALLGDYSASNIPGMSGPTDQKAFAPVEYMDHSGRRKIAIPTIDPRSGKTAFRDVPVGEGATLVAGRETAQEVGEKAVARESGKLQAQLKLSPTVAAEVARAKAIAEQEVDNLGEARSNEAAFNVYNTAMNGLASAMQNTSTGPFVGWLPAVTTNQQVAEGAVAAMAPILKQMFRAAGEGTFTDKDQELLLDMVPTRSDTPEARIAKMQNIDAIVRAKFGVNQGAAQSQPAQPSVDDLVNKYAD